MSEMQIAHEKELGTAVSAGEKAVASLLAAEQNEEKATTQQNVLQNQVTSLNLALDLQTVVHSLCNILSVL